MKTIKETKAFWKAGTQIPVSATVAYSTIENLKKTLGKDTLTAKELLDASRDENAPLHSCFEWDDNIAAERYRAYQARHIINSIEVEIVYEKREPITIRAQVNISPPEKLRSEGVFVNVKQAMEVPNYRHLVLKRAMMELRCIQKKYAAYSELAGVFAAINDFVKKINDTTND